MRKRLKLRYWVIALLVLPALSACYPDGAQYTDDLDLVYTNYDDKFDFKAKHTYAIPDSVIKITGEVFTDPDGDHKPSFMSPTYAVPLLAQIKQNLNQRGWTQVSKLNNPDMVVLVSSTTTTNIYYWYDWWYWSWWYPYWGSGWGWYYPYYPVYVSSYKSGSVFIQMIDNRPTVTEEKIPVEWSCIINGLAEGGSSDIIARLKANTDQAFVQSPYLSH